MSQEIVLTVGVTAPTLTLRAVTPTVVAVVTSSHARLTLNARSVSTLAVSAVEAL